MLLSNSNVYFTGLYKKWMYSWFAGLGMVSLYNGEMQDSDVWFYFYLSYPRWMLKGSVAPGTSIADTKIAGCIL